MVGSGRLGRQLLTALLLLTACSGRSTSPAADAGVNGGAGGTVDECIDSAADGGCGGEAGEQALAPYAPLRPACGHTTRVNRRGDPVSICYRIR
jgi:hypothetical protein